MKINQNLLAGCGLAIVLAWWAFGPDLTGDPMDTTVHVDEHPFFETDSNAVGPLTMAELKLNIPAEIDQQLTDEQRICFVNEVERQIAEAGDPATLDPADVNFLPTDGSWEELEPGFKRTLLAQVVISNIIHFCP